MPKQSGNPLWDYFKVNEDASKAVCILCKKSLFRGSKEPLQFTFLNYNMPRFYASPSSGEAYRDRQLTTNFEF